MLNNQELVAHLMGIIKDLREFDRYSGYQSMINSLEEDVRLLTERLENKTMQWISVTERLPEDDPNLHFHDDGRLRFTSVFTASKEKGVSISNRLKVEKVGNPYLDVQATDGWVWSLNSTDEVTHWMPLPKLSQKK